MKTKTLLISAFSTACVLISSIALSWPAYEEEWVFFSDASRTQVVGEKFVSCYTGTHFSGSVTQYAQRISKVRCSIDR